MNIKPYSGLVAGVVASTVIISPALSADLQTTDFNLHPEASGLQVQSAIAKKDAGTPQISTVSQNNQAIADILNTKLDHPPTLTAQNNQPTTTTPATTTSSPAVSEPTILFPDPKIPSEGKPSPTTTDNLLKPSAPIPPFLPRASAPPVGDISVSTIDTSLPNYVDLGTAAVVPRLVLREAPVQDVLTLLSRSANLNLVFADAKGSADGASTADSSGGGGIAGKTISLDLENEPVQDVFNYVLMLSDLKATMRGRTIFVGTNLPGAITPKITRTFRLNQVKVDQARCYLEKGSASYTVTSSSDLTAAPAASTGCTGGSATTTTASTTNGKSSSSSSLQDMFSKLEIMTDQRLNSITLTGEPKVVEIASNFLTQLDARKRQVAVNIKILDITLSGNRSISSDIKLLLEHRVGISAGDGIVLSPGDVAKLPGSAFSAFDPTTPNAEFGKTTAELGTILDPGDGPEGTTSVTVENGQIIANGVKTVTAANGALSSIPFRIGLGTLIPSNATGTNFIGKLVAGLLSNTTSKVISDPTLIIQEGETANLKIDQEVLAGTETQTIPISDTQNQVIQVPKKEKVGLQVAVRVGSIDDNGFVSINVLPKLSGINQIVNVQTASGNQVVTNQVALKTEDSLESGLVRLRDDQTLILAGLVRENNNVSTSKVPLLGDIPIIGSLFRNSSTSTTRRELLFIITPQIIDDSQNATWGYGYAPSDTAQELLKNENLPTQNRF